jgi:hypothetical protein
MREILVGDNIKITEDQHIYKIEFKYGAYKLIKSLINSYIIQGASTDETYKTLRFKAQTVKTLKQYKKDMWDKNADDKNAGDKNAGDKNADDKNAGDKNKISITDAAKMVNYLSKQLNYLIDKENSTILGYNIDEIIVINDDKFAFIGSELIVNMEREKEKREMIKISSPFLVTDFFVSPEMIGIKEIPSFIHYKTSYFSLALLIIHCLVGENDFYMDYINNKQPERILESLNDHPIKNTRLFWLLSRCLDEDPTNRSIILI